MSSIFSGPPLWSGDHCYVTAQEDFLHHHIDPIHLNVGTTCLMICSSDLFRRFLEIVPPVDDGNLWPYSAPFLKGDRKRDGDGDEVSWQGVPTPRVWPAD